MNGRRHAQKEGLMKVEVGWGCGAWGRWEVLGGGGGAGLTGGAAVRVCRAQGWWCGGEVQGGR